MLDNTVGGLVLTLILVVAVSLLCWWSLFLYRVSKGKWWGFALLVGPIFLIPPAIGLLYDLGVL